MSRTVLVPLAEGFEEIEAVTIVDVLRRAGVGVTTAALGKAREVKGAHGVVVSADTTLEDARKKRWDAVVLPGGMPGATNLRDDARVREALCAVVEQGGTAAAICAAPIALEAAGLLKGRKATAYPGFREELKSASARVADRVVTDGPIVTSCGPGTAMEFALTLAERFAGRETATSVRSGMLA
jgi:4-methyl-5(b-hydroxyethyl)-thiazole monophosphate biosynthesis